MGDLDELRADEVAKSIGTNLVGPAVALSTLMQLMRRQGYGRDVILSLVAGLRVCRSNFLSWAAKAGPDGSCQGLSRARVVPAST
jgi:NAD(P)-dependent dehydrogenase (short-subunit alcohol dehydrogenase family)